MKSEVSIWRYLQSNRQYGDILFRANTPRVRNIFCQDLVAGDSLNLMQSKTGRYRMTTMNGVAVDAVQTWLQQHPDPHPDAPLFISQRTRKALTVSPFINQVKRWCANVGLKGNFGSHTLRKTWGYHQLRDTVVRFDPYHLSRSLKSRQDRNHALRLREQQTMDRAEGDPVLGQLTSLNDDRAASSSNMRSWTSRYGRKIRSLGSYEISLDTIYDLLSGD